MLNVYVLIMKLVNYLMEHINNENMPMSYSHIAIYGRLQLTTIAIYRR